MEVDAMCGYWIMPQRNCQLLKRFHGQQSECEARLRQVPWWTASFASYRGDTMPINYALVYHCLLLEFLTGHASLGAGSGGSQ